MKFRLLPLVALALLSACGRKGAIEDGGIWVERSACPIAGIPAGTGDITLFDPANSVAASAIDVSATITNLRVNCNDQGDRVVSTLSFDVVATRRDPAQARQVVLPYFDVVLRAGSQVSAKRLGYIGLNFAPGSYRTQTSGQATASVHRGAASLPPEVLKTLTRPRKVGDASAAVDPLTDPKVREAVANATFEHLVGFQLTEPQLRYNVTR
ncbi:MAG TPA: hypothetical protein VGE68_10600 [Sphingomicrobium sp.]